MKNILKSLFKKRTDLRDLKRYCEIEYGVNATSAYNLLLAGYTVEQLAGEL